MVIRIEELRGITACSNYPLRKNFVLLYDHARLGIHAVCGLSRVVCSAVKIVAIMAFCDNMMFNRSPNGPFFIKDVPMIRVPIRAIGRIIGKNGRKVQEIEIKSGARVKFRYELGSFVEGVCHLFGNSYQTKIAKDLIMRVVNQFQRFERLQHRSGNCPPEIVVNSLYVPKYCYERLYESGDLSRFLPIEDNVEISPVGCPESESMIYILMRGVEEDIWSARTILLYALNKYAS